MSTITIFSAGGAGTNIATRFAQLHEQPAEGFADINTYFIDTSRSNLSKEIPDDRVFLYKDHDGKALDGNGKLRKSNYSVISESSTIKSIIDKFKPGDLSVVLHSAGGGTGSVAGPLIAKELIRQGLPVIVILVGSTISRTDALNTLNTLKTYENLSHHLESPLNVLYRENSTGRPRHAIDAEIEQYIYLLAAFWSGKNHGLDTADLRNFLFYNKVTDYKPRLTAFDMFSGALNLPDNATPIAAVTLTTESTEVEHGMLVDYQATGVAHEKVAQTARDKLPLHAVVYAGFFPPIVTRLSELLKEHEKKASQVSERTITTSSDRATDDGLIL